MSCQRLGRVALLCLWLAGCASPQALREERIAAEQTRFDRYPPAIQQQIRQGGIDVGFTENMVRLAWGEPDQVLERKTEQGVSRIWRYARLQHEPRLDWVSVPSVYLDSSGRQAIYYRHVWVDHGRTVAVPVARVEFQRGRVVAIERLESGG